MLGPRINTVFASRWKALWWAGSILLTAYCSIPSPDETAEPGQADAKQAEQAAAALKAMMGDKSADDDSEPPVNPWAKSGH